MLSNKVVAVIGMHRSGTSWLAGTLESAGLPLGNVSTWNQHNQKGNRESSHLVSIHESVLTKSGGSWRDPPTQVSWDDDDRQSLREFIARMDDRFPSWGFKDPRTLLVADEWLSQLGPRLRFIAVYRHPAAVSRSLANRRRAVPLEEGPHLWTQYNQRLIELWHERPFPLIRFDGDQAVRDESVAAILAQLDLDPSRATFYEAALVHSDPSTDEALSPECERVWAQLEQTAAIWLGGGTGWPTELSTGPN